MTLRHKRLAHLLIRSVLLGCIWLAQSGSSVAQTTTGSVYGAVTDSSGALIPGASVIVTNVQTGEAHAAKTDRAGNYVFVALVPGDYRMTAATDGFATLTESGVRVDASQNVHVNFALHAGNLSQDVTVSAATTLVDTRESQLGSTVDQRRVQDLPTTNRDAYSLVQILPGVTAYKGNTDVGNQVGTQFTVNGNQSDENSFYFDGAFDAAIYRNGGNKIPNPDAIEQFRLLTSNFDAEYGRNPGGVVNVITRSGTNRFHGVAYDYLRNNIFNAKNYFQTSVTPLHQNQFGGAFGGPIKPDKLFFFVSYEGFRLRTPFTVTSSSIVTPTPAEAAGDFSAAPAAVQATLKTIVTCGKKYIICPTALDPVAQNALKYVPLADPVTGLTPQQASPANANADQGLARIDYQLSNAHLVSGTFFTSRGLLLVDNAAANQILNYARSSNYENQTNIVASDLWTISPNKLNSLRFFYTLNHFIISSLVNDASWASLGSTVKQGTLPSTPPTFTITNYWSMGVNPGGNPNNQYDESFGALDTFNWSLGRHAVKFGGSFLWSVWHEAGTFQGTGTATFTGGTTGNGLADFLEGHAATLLQNNGAYHRLRAPDPALFVQDDWRVSQRLTLNLGVHWEEYAPFIGNNNVGTFVPNAQSTRFPTAPLGLLISGDPGVPDGIQKAAYTKFAPRVGFAYDVFGDGKTSLRGGFGFFFASARETLYENLEQQPFTLSVTTNITPNLVSPYAPRVDPFPYVSSASSPTFTSGGAIAGLNPNNKSIPYVQEYNLTVEQQFGTDWSTRIAYVGNTQRKYYLVHDINAPVYSPSCTAATCGTTATINARRPYQPTPSAYTFAQIGITDPIANASYNSLQATLTRRFTHGFSLLASYVWSKSVDIQASFTEGIGTTLVNQNNAAMDRGPAASEIPNAFVASYVWAIPTPKSWHGIERLALGGWQINGITTLQSGSPFNVTSGKDTNFDGTNNDRPNRIGNPSLGGGRSRAQKIAEFFDPSAFAQVPAGVPYGNVGRDSLLGPGFINNDISAFKSVPIFRESSLQFRGEIFNALNNVNLGNPNANISTLSGNKQAGRISSSGAPRIVQFALRYSF